MHDKRAFTLVEIMVVSVILSFVMVGVTAAFLSGMRVWRRAQAIQTVQADLMLGMESLGRELRKSVPVTGLKYTGAANELAFATIVGDRLVWRMYELDGGKGLLIKKTGAPENEDGNDTTDMFVQLPDTVVFAADAVRFSYLDRDTESDTYVWVDEWDKPDRFRAVRMTVEREDRIYEKTFVLAYDLQG